MTTYAWRISATGNWNTAGDWIPAGPPNSDTADAVIKTVGTHVVNISVGEAFTANQVTLDAATTTLKLASGGTLTLAGTTAALVLNAGTFVLDGLLQGGTVEADGATAQLGGTLEGVTWLGPLAFGPGEALTVVGGLSVHTAAGGSPGTIDMSAGGDTLTLISGETLDHAILNFSGSDYLVDATTGGTLTLGSGFTLDGSVGTLTATAGNIVNSGTIARGGGSILQAPGITKTGSVTIGAGGKLAAFDITGNTGIITVGSGGLLSVTYLEGNSGVVAVDNGGTLFADSFASSQPFTDNGLLEVNGNFSANGITIADGGTLIRASTVGGNVTDTGLTPDGTAIVENTIPPYYVWATALSGDWATNADWTPAGPPDAATANAVIDTIGSYTVSISNGESFLANALTLATAGATLSVAGTLTLNEITSDGLIDIAGGTVDVSQGTLNNAGVVTIGPNGALDGELILNAVAANGGGITIAAGGTLDLLGGRTLSGDTVAGLGSVTSTGGLLLVVDSLNLGGGTLDVAATTGPLGEFGVAGELANGTVDANAGAILLENGVILNGVTWQGTLTIFGAESIAGVARGNGINVAGGRLTNDGTITGGGGSYGNLNGANGVNATGSSLTNNGMIAGGNGGNGPHLGSGGPGGTGMSLEAGSNLLNIGLIKGGAGGYDPGLHEDYFAGGGAGAVVSNSTLTNLGTILGGTSGDYGGTGVGVILTSGLLTNDGSIAGGPDGSFHELGGAGVAVRGGTLINNGAITGDSNSFYGGNGVDITNGTLTDDGTITGGNGPSGFNGRYIGIGVLFHGGGTLTDAGFIGGGNGGTADAVEFGTAASRLILDPGASFSGAVVADAAFGNELELASAASAGTLAGLGSQYVGFGRITIDAGASWMLNGANTIVTGAILTELSGATLIAPGTLVNDGAIVLDPSTMTVSGLTGTGSVTIDAGSTLEAQSTIAGGQTLGFGGSGAYLHLDSPDSVAGTVTNFGFGETIDLKGIDPTSVSYADGRLSFSGGSFALSLANTAPVIASASGDGAAITAPCFRAGTRILTPSGERPVQQLAVGDLVWTVLGEAAAPIVWVGRREVDCARHPNPGRVWPVRVSAEAFGPGQPHADLFLSPDHAVYVADVLIPVKHLINGSSIAQVPVDRVSYYHLELPEHDVLLAEGLPAESYLDTGDRCNFENDGGPIALYPDFSARRWDTAHIWEALGCARLIVTGPNLNAARMLVHPSAAARAQTDAATKHAA